MTFAVVELHEDGTQTILKQRYTLSDLTRAALDGEFFPSVFVSHEDLIIALLRDNGIDNLEGLEGESPARQDEIRVITEKINAISDGDMEHLCSKLQDHLVEHGGYFDWLAEWLKTRNITLPDEVD